MPGYLSKAFVRFKHETPHKKLDVIVRTGIAREDAPTCSGKHAYQGNIEAAVASGNDPKDAPSHFARRTCDSRRICPSLCCTVFSVTQKLVQILLLSHVLLAK